MNFSLNRGVLHLRLKVYEARLKIFYHYCYSFFAFILYIIIIKKTASGIFAKGARKKTRKKYLHCLDLKTWYLKMCSSSFLDDCASGLYITSLYIIFFGKGEQRRKRSKNPSRRSFKLDCSIKNGED